MSYVQLSSGKAFEISNNESILNAAAKSGVVLPYSCKTGRCSTCKCKLISGETGLLFSEIGLTDADKAEGWILSCVRTATTDLVLDVQDLGCHVLPSVKTLACRINSLEKLTHDVIKVTLRLPPSAAFHFIPGQYIEVIGPDGERRSYSLANSPRADKTLELYIKAVEGGAMSHYWFDKASANDLLRLNGPFGTFFIRNISQRELIFLATGTGIAPVKAMLEGLLTLAAEQMPKSVTVFWGARHEHDLYFDVSALPGAHLYIPVLSRATEWNGERGYIQSALLRRKSDLRDCSVYACGSDAMIQSAKVELTSAGLPGHHFYSDAFVCSGTNASQ